MYVCMFLFIYVWKYACVYVCVYACIYMRVRVRVCVRARVCVCVKSWNCNSIRVKAGGSCLLFVKSDTIADTSINLTWDVTNIPSLTQPIMLTLN